jgi:fucose permease
MTVAALLVTGMGVALLGSLKLPLARRLGIDEARVGGMVSIFGFVMIPVVLTAGFFTDLVGAQAVLTVGFAVFAASLGVLAGASSYPTALAGVLLLGAGWATAINVVNVLTPVAFGGTVAYAVNLANFFFGLGAFLTPLTAAWLIRRAGFPIALWVLASLAVIPAVFGMGADFSVPVSDVPPHAAGGGLVAVTGLLADPMLWLCGAGLFFYGPLEAATAAWTTTYLRDKGISEAAASGLLSGFWLAYMVSRLVTAFTLPQGAEAALVLAMALAALGITAAIVWSRSRAAAVVLIIGAGLVFGPIFPTLMATLLGHFDSPVHGRAVGLFFAIGGVGWTTIPMLIGAYASRRGVQRGFLLAAASSAGLCAVAVALLVSASQGGAP